MPRTKDADRIGTTAAYAAVLITTPLPDPTDVGNLGLEGYNEEWETSEHATPEQARAWCEAFQVTEPDRVTTGRVEVVTWEPDEWDDDELGHILDATERVLTQQWGSVEPDGWEWGEAYDA